MQNLLKSRHIGRTMLFTIAALVSTSPAAATQETKQSASPDDEIIVSGQKARTEIIRQLIVNQFNTSGGGNQNGQYARFAAPICPSVGGLPEKQAAMIEDRIRDIAEVADLLVAPAKCKANLFVVAVDDGAKEIETLRKRRGTIFTSLSHRERDKMVETGGPVYSWKATQAMSSDGRHSARAGTIDIMSDSIDGPISVRGQRSHVKSKIQQSEFAGIAFSYLLIENQALTGVSLNQLADYAAVVSLIDIDVKFETTPPPNSILSLFSETPTGQGKPGSIGEGDLLMLRGLYKVPANIKAGLQRSAMLHTIDAALDSGKDREGNAR